MAVLEAKLVELTAQLQQRRESVPQWMTQQLEEQNRAALGTLMSSADAAAATAASEGAASQPEETRLALAGALQQCAAVSVACAEQATGEVQRALDQATEIATQISKTIGTVGTGCPTATDLAIAPPGGGADERNKENNDVAAALRRRREAQQRERAAADLSRQMSSAPHPFLTM